jgi:hypothetical protein
MREIIGTFPERAKNFHRNISDMWIPGASRWLTPSVMWNSSKNIWENVEKTLKENDIWRDFATSSYFPFFTVKEHCQRSFLQQTGKIQYIIIAKSLRIH